MDDEVFITHVTFYKLNNYITSSDRLLCPWKPVADLNVKFTISIHFNDMSVSRNTTKKPTTVVTDLHIWLSLNVPHTRPECRFLIRGCCVECCFSKFKVIRRWPVLERKTRLVIHNAICSLSYSFVVSYRSFVANIAGNSDNSNSEHNIPVLHHIKNDPGTKPRHSASYWRSGGTTYGESIYNE